MVTKTIYFWDSLIFLILFLSKKAILVIVIARFARIIQLKETVLCFYVDIFFIKAVFNTIIAQFVRIIIILMVFFKHFGYFDKLVLIFIASEISINERLSGL